MPSVFLNMNIYLNVEKFEVKSSLPQVKIAQKKGIEGLCFKALSMCRKSCLLILPFQKLVGHLNTIFFLGVEISTNQSLKTQIPRELPGKK